MTAHTPGPWEVGTVSNDGFTQPIYGNVDGGKVARAEFCVRGGTETDKANARLIASAPALLAALRELVNAFEEREGSRLMFASVGPSLVKDARAAIVAAEGLRRP